METTGLSRWSDINRMKMAMSKREFDRVMRELARYRREGGEFDGKVVRFKYWRKVAGSGV